MMTNATTKGFMINPPFNYLVTIDLPNDFKEKMYPKMTDNNVLRISGGAAVDDATEELIRMMSVIRFARVIATGPKCECYKNGDIIIYDDRMGAGRITLHVDGYEQNAVVNRINEQNILCGLDQLLDEE